MAARGTDQGYGLAVDGTGNVYVSGYSTATWGSPVAAYNGGGVDAFVAKLDNNGNLIWNTFLGGTGNDEGFGVAVDGIGNVYVAGYSDATWGSPVRAYTGSFEAFAAKLDSSGTLIWNTFLGSGGFDIGRAVAVDGTGNVYVAGYSAATWGSPTRPFSGVQDAFAAKLDLGGNLIWNTFLGGSGTDFGNAIAVDAIGNVYVAGSSEAGWGTPVRAYAGGTAAFVAKLDFNGAITWNTFLGSGLNDSAEALALDVLGNVYVTGNSAASWGAPVAPYSGGEDAFAAKLASSGALVWNTFFGSSATDTGEGIAVDGIGNVDVAGYSDATWGSPTRSYSGSFDAFAVQLSPAGAVTWNTFLGSASADFAQEVAVDLNGNVYVAGFSDATWGAPVRALWRRRG